MKDLSSILSHFALTGKVVEIKPLGAGLINDSYKVTTTPPEAPDYVLQRINHTIFTQRIFYKLFNFTSTFSD